MSKTLVRDKPAEIVSQALTHREILRFYLPLAASWIFMAVEAPTCTAILGRLPARELNTAAFQVLMALSLWIESPVIDLLSTSTTLAKTKQSFAQLSRFVWHLMAWVTFAHALLTLTPLYWFVSLRILSLPQEVAVAARPGLIIMLPWSAFIGWRRYLQGVLIRFNKTRLVGFGTLVRVSSISLVGWSLYATATRTHLTGIQIAAISLICAVGAEAGFAHLASRTTVRERFRLGPAVYPDSIAGEDVEQEALYEPDVRETANCNGSQQALTYQKLLAFHLPLTATTMVMLCGNLVISAALSKSSSQEAELALASWQVAGTLIWFCRTVVFALPEVVITLYRDEQTRKKLRDFSIWVGLVTTFIMAVVALFGLDKAFDRAVLGESLRTAEMAHVGFCVAVALPFIGALQSYVRGMLTAHHLTVARFLSVLVSIAALVIMLAIGVMEHWLGVVNASVAITVSTAAELVVLYLSLVRGTRRLGLTV